MTAPSTHRATKEQGPSIVEGRLIWTSATGITTADPQSYGGCLRKWWLDQVAGLKAPATKAMMAGTDLHAEIENRLLTGASLQTRLALAGGMFIPQPGTGLFVERPIHFKTSTGVDIYGHVDLYNTRQEYIDAEGALQQDPAWTFEVKDWKTTSSFEYAKSERDLAENIQLNTYAEAGFRVWPDSEHARLTHVYFRTKGRPESKLVTIRRSREEITQRWQYAESVVRIMVDVAREPTAETVPGNRKACNAYSGCPHRGNCSVYQRTSLDALFSKIATDHTASKELEMGLLANNPQMLQQPAQAQAPQPDMRATLAAEEAAMRAQAAQQQQQMPSAQPTMQQLAEICVRLGSYGYGFPSLAGNAAMVYAQMGGQNVAPGFVYQGVPAPAGAKRTLHSIQLTEVAHILQIEGELAAEARAAAPPAPVQYTQYVPAAPAPTPPANSALYTQKLEQAYAPPAAGGILPPGAPESMPQLAQAYVPTAVIDVRPTETVRVDVASGAVTVEEKKKGRPKKEKVLDAAPEETAAVAALPPPPPSAPAPQVPPVATSSLCAETEAGWGSVLINARFGVKPTKSLAGYVDYINSDLSKRYSVTSDGKPGIQDVRCVPKDSPLAFGGWKGAVREVVKADPPPQGDYHLDTFMDELNEVVADALRVVAEQKGWIYVRGVR